MGPKTNSFNRRSQKIVSTFVSYFTSCFILNWNIERRIEYPLCFDGRVICYPNFDILNDYLKWRQTDCHVNNLYNTVFWAIVKSGNSEKDAHGLLKGTTSAVKNQMLFEKYGKNYNNEPEMFRKGTVMVRPDFSPMHVDIFHKEFYEKYGIINI